MILEVRMILEIPPPFFYRHPAWAETKRLPTSYATYSASIPIVSMIPSLWVPANSYVGTIRFECIFSIVVGMKMYCLESLSETLGYSQGLGGVVVRWSVGHSPLVMYPWTSTKKLILIGQEHPEPLKTAVQFRAFQGAS